MHTTAILKSSDLLFIQDGRTIRMKDVLPGFTILDRLGVVMRKPTDGIGASNFILACVTAFYDLYRAKEKEFFTYPDYFTFQASANVVSYCSLDIWPDNKSIQVKNDVECVFQEINDRGVNILVVPEGPIKEHEFDRVTLSSAERRIRCCYLYSPNGKVSNPNLHIRRLRGPIDSEIREAFHAFRGEGSRPELQAQENGDYDRSNFVEQSYRRIGLEDAIRFLPSLFLGSS